MAIPVYGPVEQWALVEPPAAVNRSEELQVPQRGWDEVLADADPLRRRPPRLLLRVHLLPLSSDRPHPPAVQIIGLNNHGNDHETAIMGREGAKDGGVEIYYREGEEEDLLQTSTTNTTTQMSRKVETEFLRVKKVETEFGITKSIIRASDDK